MSGQHRGRIIGELVTCVRNDVFELTRLRLLQTVDTLCTCIETLEAARLCRPLIIKYSNVIVPTISHVFCPISHYPPQIQIHIQTARATRSIEHLMSFTRYSPY